MKKLLFALVLLLIPTAAVATSWAYPFVVYNDGVYIITEEKVEEVGEKIGEVTYYSDMEQHSGNFSNQFKKGTAYHKIEGIDVNVAIAVQVSDNEYIKATYDGPYEYNGSIVEKITDIIDPVEEPVEVIGGNYFKWIVIGCVIGVLALIVLARRGDRRK